MRENAVVLGDCVTGMRRLSGGCIDLTLTSPPYDGLRTYGGHARWDFGAVARELYRVTVPGGVVVWVVQEQIIDGAESGESSRQRLAFEDIGFRLHHTMVMGKTGGHQHAPRRYGRPLEYAFILSKGRPRYFCPIRDKRNREAGRVKVFKNRRSDGTFRPLERRTTHPFGIRPGVWEYPTGRNNSAREGYAFAHPALMPERMAADHIRSWSRVNDLVFDPFAGAGTTLKMARLNFRRCLGFEVNLEYAEIAVRRLREAEDTLRSARSRRTAGRQVHRLTG